jgi:hypothetical protein
MVYLGANVLDQLRAAVFRSDVALDPASAVSAQSPTNTTRHFRQKGLTYATTSPPSVAVPFSSLAAFSRTSARRPVMNTLAPFDENPSAMAEGHVSGIRISSCAALSTGAGVGAAAERARESMEDEDHSAYPCPNRNLRL